MKIQLCPEYELKCDDLKTDLLPHSPFTSTLNPQRALRSAGGDEGGRCDSVNGFVDS